MALTSGTDLDRHNPDHPPGRLIGMTFAAEAAHTTTTRAFVPWLLGGIFTPQQHAPTRWPRSRRRCPPTTASATVVRAAWTRAAPPPATLTSRLLWSSPTSRPLTRSRRDAAACTRSGGHDVIGAGGHACRWVGGWWLGSDSIASRAEITPRARSRRAVGRGLSLADGSVAALGVDLGNVEDGDASAAEPDQSPFGVVAEHFGGGLAGGPGQRRDLLVGQCDDR